MFNINSVIERTLIYFPIFKLLINNIHFAQNNNEQTACTNGDTIYYNSSFLQTLTKDEQVFILAHELMHITLKHLSRLENRNMEIWNYATDAIINQLLKQNGLPLVEGVVDCPDALSYSAEEYYDIIANRSDCEELMKKYRQSVREHVVATHEHWSEESKEDLAGYLPDIAEQEVTEINKEMIHDENQAYKKHTKESESTSTSLGSVGDASSVIDWKSFLQRKKRKITAADYNLHHGYFDEDGFYKYPYEVIRTANIEILIDTSYSVDDDLVKAFLQECKNIFGEYEIKVGCFDTKFYGFQKITNKKDLDNFVISGRGGTDFSVAVNSFSKKSPVKIIFTDGYADMPKGSSDVIWVVYGLAKINPPGGIVFYVDPDSLTLKGKTK